VKYLSAAAVTATSCATGGLSYCATVGNTVAATAAAGGWSATVTNVNLSGKTCAIYVNTTAVAPATSEGAPACN
jgi:hypothetical protein